MNQQTDFYNDFRYPVPEGFDCGLVMAGFFIHAYISNPDEITPGRALYKPENKPKYAFVLSYPYHNRKLQLTETANEKFSCSEEDYNFLRSCTDLNGKPVYIQVAPGSWANNSERHGIWYQFVSGTMRRFDGKPLGATPPVSSKS